MYTFGRNNPLELASDRPEYVPKKRCENCVKYKECVKRLRGSMWLMCEIPTLDDLKMMGMTVEEYNGQR